MNSNENNISVEGNNNIIIQDVNGSTIKVDISNSEALSDFLQNARIELLKQINEHFKYVPKSDDISNLLAEIEREIKNRNIKNQINHGEGNNINANNVTINYKEQIEKNFKFFLKFSVSFLKAHIKLEIGVLSILIITSITVLHRDQIRNLFSNTPADYFPVCCGGENNVVFGSSKEVIVVTSINVTEKIDYSDSLKIQQKISLIIRLQEKLSLLREVNDIDTTIIKSIDYSGTLVEVLRFLNKIEESIIKEIEEIKKIEDLQNNKWKIGDTIPYSFLERNIERYERTAHAT